MTIEIIPAEELPLSEQAVILTEAFAGYVGGSFAMDAAGPARFLCAQGADLCHSRFARVGADVCAFAYINHTLGVTRIGGMGVRPAARRTGVARRLLEHVVAEAQARRDDAIILEVIEQNPAAHTLYRQAGFREIDRLTGWRRQAETRLEESPASKRGLLEITLAEACHAQPGAAEYPILPWAVSRYAMAKLFSARAYAKEGVNVVISNPDLAGPIRVHALFAAGDRPSSRLRLSEVLSDVIACYPGREFFAPPVFPESLAKEIFAPFHFEQEKISQFLMRRKLAPDSATCD